MTVPEKGLLRHSRKSTSRETGQHAGPVDGAGKWLACNIPPTGVYRAPTVTAVTATQYTIPPTTTPAAVERLRPGRGRWLPVAAVGATLTAVPVGYTQSTLISLITAGVTAVVGRGKWLTLIRIIWLTSGIGRPGRSPDAV